MSWGIDLRGRRVLVTGWRQLWDVTVEYVYGELHCFVPKKPFAESCVTSEPSYGSQTTQCKKKPSCISNYWMLHDDRLCSWAMYTILDPAASIIVRNVLLCIQTICLNLMFPPGSLFYFMLWQHCAYGLLRRKNTQNSRFCQHRTSLHRHPPPPPDNVSQLINKLCELDITCITDLSTCHVWFVARLTFSSG